MYKYVMACQIIVVTVLVTGAFSIEDDVVDHLFNNRKYLSDLAQPVNINVGPKIMHIYGESSKTIQQYSNLTKSIWKTDRNKILDAFLGLCNKFIKFDTLSLLNDTILIQGTVKILDCGIQRHEYEAYRLLVNYVPYKYLGKYSNEIITRVDSATIRLSDKQYLTALCYPPKNVQEKLLADSTISLPLRARLSDQNAENLLLNKFEKFGNFEDMNRAARDLFLCGSVNCLRNLFLSFNTPVYEMGKKCISGSIRVTIIEGLKRYYPDEPLFGRKFYQLYKKSCNVYIDQPYYTPDPEVKAYLQDVIAWGKKEFGVTPRGEIGEPILFKGPCDSLHQQK
jgi:hypothetical protein